MDAENYAIAIWGADMELYYLSHMHFYGISEADLVRKQAYINEVLKKINHVHSHSYLSQLLSHRLIHKGNVRSELQKKELNDLVLSEINLRSKLQAPTSASIKTHLLFQSNYFISVNDYKSAYKGFIELKELFSEEPPKDTTLDHLIAIEGILNSLQMLGMYSEMNLYIDLLKGLGSTSHFISINKHKIEFIYSIALLLHQDKFDEAAHITTVYEQSLLQKISVLDPINQAEVFLYCALIQFGKNNIAEAHTFLNKILFESSTYYQLPIYQVFRLLNLLIQYEFGNNSYIAAETRSVKRKWKQSTAGSYLLEKMIFKFIHQPLPDDVKEIKKLEKQVHEEFLKIKSDRNEIRLLRIFDFEAWVIKKLKKTEPYRSAGLISP
jgi:hypothetical protein